MGGLLSPTAAPQMPQTARHRRPTNDFTPHQRTAVEEGDKHTRRHRHRHRGEKDESEGDGSASARAKNVLRTFRGAFSRETTTSTLTPDQVYAHLMSACEQLGYPIVNDGYAVVVKASQGIGIRAEVGRLYGLDDTYVVNLRRQSGDSWQFRKICAKITALLNLNNA
ncbi:hypothetical protein KIPB_012052 [Kipferlia bialata]|uniref:non-specific serine/threonine protein kinase n=1 Tax=Kipferlia bialata TaxID=797122 RepID=A0A9K3D5M4_9EUKA|nr:hypothetical protein KIPB_012052 [Kipferlia bialata]|eukprot:g12052.t1